MAPVEPSQQQHDYTDGSEQSHNEMVLEHAATEKGSAKSHFQLINMSFSQQENGVKFGAAQTVDPQ